MNKYLLLKYILSFVVFIIIWMLLNYFTTLHAGFKGAIAAALIFVFLPKIKRIDTLSGKKLQTKWFFNKKVHTK